MGVRVEHPQELIDNIQYHCRKDKYLPAASYNLVEQVNGRGVYSFCMCPGGQIVPSATAQFEIVVNGMSVSRRNSPFANSGIVVQVMPADYRSYQNLEGLAGLRLQELFEQKAYRQAHSGQRAPAQRLTDFVSNRPSQNLPVCSYLPGLVNSPMHEWLPDFIKNTLQEGFRKFDTKMRGFLSRDAIIVGVESRTSSPVRIPRDPETGNHVSVSTCSRQEKEPVMQGVLFPQQWTVKMLPDAVLPTCTEIKRKFIRISGLYIYKCSVFVDFISQIYC